MVYFDKYSIIMASQSILGDAITPIISNPPAINLPSGFHIQPADSQLNPIKNVPLIVPAEPPLGVLSNFTGNFAGTGFNMIFRPNGAPITPITFPIPVTQPVTPPQPPNENVLEINLTSETLTFSPSLGEVPNRGLGLDGQGDIKLNGIPYVQAISDVTNVDTGKGNGKAIAIHFEPGLWMHVPATNVDPVLGETLVRMASIPHGTTINAQTVEGPVTFTGEPNFTDSTKSNFVPIADPTPFPIIPPGGTPTRLTGVFDGLTISPTNAPPRLPQDLSKFNTAGTITQEILNNPNVVLGNANQGKVITSTIAFTVSTSPIDADKKTQTFGGGTANIAFLEGTGASASATSQPRANASAASMTATFWIEKVQHKILIPVFKPGQSPLHLQPTTPHPGAKVPTFLVNPPHEISKPITITVESKQIQYSQIVNLNFAGLTWPHISVATLVPSGLLSIPPSAWS